MTDTLIQRLSDEADLCRNDGATDVAKLLDDAVYEIVNQAAQIAEKDAEIARLRGIVPEALEKLNDELCAENEALRADAERLKFLREKSAYVGINPHARTCLWVLRGIYEIPGQGFDAAIDAALRQEGPKP